MLNGFQQQFVTAEPLRAPKPNERFIQLLMAEVGGEQPPPSMAEHLQGLERRLSDEEHALLVHRT